jgi:ubiquinone/menaquinone biosynthesis C-methylase UbiE
MRLGTYYRSLLWDKIGIKANGLKVLDIGGFDGYWLAQQKAVEKYCIDINPQGKYEGVTYIKADALEIPFSSDYFDQVFAFEVIEHVSNEEKFISELYRVTKPGGQIVISTPHKDIKLFPPFLSNWVSRKWGHDRVNGYYENEIRAIMPINPIAEFIYLREPFYRFFYLPLRFIWAINCTIARLLVKVIVSLDTLFLKGVNGHIIVRISK